MTHYRARSYGNTLLLGFAICALLGVASPLRAQDAQPPAASPEAAAPAAEEAVPPPAEGAPDGAALEDDPWGFDEEEEAAETWADVVRPQILDIAVLTGFLALVMTGFFLKSERLKYITWVIAIAYMGFTKSYLISVVNIFGVINWNLPIFRYNLAWYLFAIFTVVSTVLWGRVYCGRVCAYGALTQLMDRVIPARLRIEIPQRIERRANLIKYGVLAGTVGYFVLTSNMAIYQYVEPFWMFGLFQTTPMWIALGFLLLATVFVRNLYCRFLCPVGATLGLLSNLTVFRIKRWSECKTCKLCEKTCEWGAIQGPKILVTECVRCDDCERLYADQQKCPHWLILRRKANRPAPPPPPPVVHKLEVFSKPID